MKRTTQTSPISLGVVRIFQVPTPAMFWDFVGNDALSLRRTFFFVWGIFSPLGKEMDIWMSFFLLGDANLRNIH